MKKIEILLEKFFDYVVLSIVYAVSLILILPFTTAFAASISYFSHHSDSRSLKNVWITFLENKKIYMQYGLATTLLIGIAILNIRVLQFTPSLWSNILYGISWISLLFGCFFLLFAPILILRMNLNFRQLVQNTMVLILRGGLLSIILMIVGCGLFVASIYFPLILIPSLYFIIFVDYAFTNKIFYKIKKES